MPHDEIPHEKTRTLIRKSLRSVIRNDQYIIDNILYEECINHRFAVYLEKNLRLLGITGYNVDIEYDKNICNDKPIAGKNRRIDIVIHQRGNNNNNYLAIEAKKNYNDSRDRSKIDGLLADPYHYQYVCLVSYRTGRYKLIHRGEDSNTAYENLDSTFHR